MKQKLVSIIIKMRYFLLGVGLSGLHYDGWWNMPFVFIVAFSLTIIFETTDYEDYEQ